MTDERIPMNGEALDRFEDAWDKSPITAKRHSAVPVVRTYLTSSSGLRRHILEALMDEEGAAGATWAAKARAVTRMLEHDQEEGHGALSMFSLDTVWRAMDKVIKERTPSKFLIRGKINMKLLSGPRSTAD